MWSCSDTSASDEDDELEELDHDNRRAPASSPFYPTPTGINPQANYTLPPPYPAVVPAPPAPASAVTHRDPAQTVPSVPQGPTAAAPTSAEQQEDAADGV